jgi:hypothetical protein
MGRNTETLGGGGGVVLIESRYRNHIDKEVSSWKIDNQV